MCFNVMYISLYFVGERFAVKECKKLEYRALVFAVKEANFLKELQHPNIVQYVDAFFGKNQASEEIYYIVLKHANHGNLGKYIKDAKEENEYFTKEDTVDIFAQVACGMAFLHRLDPSKENSFRIPRKTIFKIRI